MSTHKPSSMAVAAILLTLTSVRASPFIHRPGYTNQTISITCNRALTVNVMKRYNKRKAYLNKA